MSSELSIGLAGILAARQALETVGYNIANATTPGYARRDVKLSGTSGGGTPSTFSSDTVSVESIIRIKDMFLEGRLQAYRGSLARNEAQSAYFSEIEGALQEPSEEGIGVALEAFFNQWQAVALRPEDATERTALLLSAAHLSEQISSLRQELVDIRTAVSAEISYQVEEVNSLASQLAEVNQQLLIGSADPANQPLSLQDERDRLLARLAEVIGAADLAPNESMTRVTIGSALLVDGAEFIPLRAPADHASPLTIDMAGDDVALEPTSGKLAGLLELSQQIMPDYLAQLDEFAANLIKAVNIVHAQGIGREGRFTEVVGEYAPRDLDGDGDSSNDLLSQAGLPFAPTAGALTINVVDNATGATTTHTLAVDPTTQSLADLRDAIGSLGNINAVLQDGRLRILASDGYSFDFAADQETDVLAALGINAFFGGYDASTIRLSRWVEDRPERVAAGATPDAGDGSNADALSNLRYASIAGEGQTTLSDSWRRFVTEVGSTSANLIRSGGTLDSMVELLTQQEQSISGVSLDEEAAKLLEYQQMYQACAQYLGVVSRLAESLLEYV